MRSDDVQPLGRAVGLVAVLVALLSMLQSVQAGPARADSTEYRALTPVRILDTRLGTGGWRGLVPGGTTVQLTVTGASGIPGDAQAAALNVTVTSGTQGGWVTIFPCGQAVPNASSLNYLPGQTVANMVIAKIGSSGRVCLRPSGTTHLIVDANGYFPAGTSYLPLQPARAADTRNGTGVRPGPVPAFGVLAVPVAGRYGVPADAAAVSMNVTVTVPSTGGWAAVFPCGAPRPNASNLNFVAGQTVANAVLSEVGTGGSICFFTSARTQVLVDVNGAFAADTSYIPFSPERLLDTRQDPVGPLLPTEVLVLTVADPGELAVISLNVTATEPGWPGWLTVFPCDRAELC
jgi:hypothetical protein